MSEYGRAFRVWWSDSELALYGNAAIITIGTFTGGKTYSCSFGFLKEAIAYIEKQKTEFDLKKKEIDEKEWVGKNG